MSEPFCPRLSQAKQLLPLLRSHLVAAASRCAPSAAPAIALLPIVDDGVFGYELLPDRDARTYLILGCDAAGEPTLRATSYGPEAPGALRLAACNGQAVTRSERAACRPQRHDVRFADWSAAAGSACTQLAAQSAARGQRHADPDEPACRALDDALAIAHAHLADWDPFIWFAGLPNEAQYGFALRGPAGARGLLISRHSGIWILRWKCHPHAVYEEWAATVPDRDVNMGLTRA